MGKHLHLMISILLLMLSIFLVTSSSGVHAVDVNDTNAVIAWTTPVTQPGSTIRIMYAAIGNGYAVCYIASNSSLQCPLTVWSSTTANNIQINIPSTSAYTSITGNYETLCGLSHQGAVTCFGSPQSGFPAQPPYQTFSSISYGSTAGCGILASSGYASCWYADNHPSIHPSRLCVCLSSHKR
jgi:biopolymer transport protein ExbD